MKYNDALFLKTVRDFLTIYLPKQRKFSENTIRSYRMSLSLFFDYLKDEKGVSIQKLSFNHLNSENVSGFFAWLQSERGNSDTSCKGPSTLTCGRPWRISRSSFPRL